MTDDERDEIQINLGEGAQIGCACGWWGWIEPGWGEGGPVVKGDCPECERQIVIECTARFGNDDD